MTPKIRTATVGDAAAIEGILAPIVAHGGLTALRAEDVEAAVTSKIASYAESGSFLVAETDRIIGFQYLSPYPGKSAHVADIATFADINQRQSGIGRALFVETRKIALSRNFHKITARIRADNADGLPYYERMGFRRVGVYERHTLIDDKYVDQVLMELILDA